MLSIEQNKILLQGARMGDVTPFGGGRREGPHDPDRDRWLRRQAVQLSAHLPDNRDDALRIIYLMEMLVRTFLDGK